MFIKNKNVLITGAANRIGREIAIHLSEIGMNIALHYNNSEENALKTLALIKKNNVKSDIFKADLSKENSCINLLENINKSLGEIPIIINNASTFRKNTLENTSIDEIKEDYFVNIIAPFIMAQKIYKNKNLKQGKIINITDWKTARENRFSYGISKAGIFGLTKSLAISMAPRFQVNEVALGAILPPADSPNRTTKNIDLGPMKRVGKISEVTSCIEMLIKNDFITGEKINIDGGRHIF
ncbi:MAG: SDR family oxidoreductase [Dehalococcoidales bacterium]|nr:SDR family oxidoreductase [Dehalococcoidales bacterium]